MKNNWYRRKLPAIEPPPYVALADLVENIAIVTADAALKAGRPDEAYEDLQVFYQALIRMMDEYSTKEASR